MQVYPLLIDPFVQIEERQVVDIYALLNDKLIEVNENQRFEERVFTEVLFKYYNNSTVVNLVSFFVVVIL